jgi:hypothetical protein
MGSLETLFIEKFQQPLRKQSFRCPAVTILFGLEKPAIL